MAQDGTRIDEIADGIYRISTPVKLPVGGFSFNRYLVLDDQPLLFHIGKRHMFQATRDAVAQVLEPAKLRYLAFSHFEADECGALNEFLAIAPSAEPVCSRIAALTSVEDTADRAPRPLADGEELALGRHTVRWFDTPHLPHGWECGYLFESATSTLFCGDLFTQPGDENAPLTESDILGPSEAMRSQLDYYAYTPNSRQLLNRLAETQPTTLACMHGSAWRGNGAALLAELATTLGV